MKISANSNLTIISLSVIFIFLAASGTKAQLLKEIFKRMDVHQKFLFSLRSKVRMEQYNTQLKETDFTEGTEIYSRSPQKQILVRVDWTRPSEESLILINGQYLIYRPRLRQAIVGNINKTKGNDKIVNALSFLKMSKGEILLNYNTQYIGQETVKDNPTWHLLFTPKKADIYKSAELWVDGNGMPIQAKIVQPNNDSTTVLISEFKKNEAIKTTDFRINLPKATSIIKNSSFTCFCFKPDSPKDALKNYSDAVFSGKIIAANSKDYTFKTEKIWKGSLGNEVIIRVSSVINDCPTSLMIGGRYVVFAQKSDFKDKNVLNFLPCSFTSNLNSDDGKNILKELGNGRSVKKIINKQKSRARFSRKKFSK